MPEPTARRAALRRRLNPGRVSCDMEIKSQFFCVFPPSAGQEIILGLGTQKKTCPAYRKDFFDKLPGISPPPEATRFRRIPLGSCACI